MSDEWVPESGHFAIHCRECGLQRRTPTLDAARAWQKLGPFEREARAAGWRLFVGRGRYWYCPDHSPRPQSAAKWYEVTR